MKKEKKPDERCAGLFRQLPLIVCLLVLIGSGAYLIKEVVWRQGSSQTYEAVAKGVWEPGETTAGPAEETKPPEDQKTEPAPEESRGYNPPPGLGDLMKSNENVKGWIYIEGTQINYPVMQHPTDNGYYLHRDLNGNRLYSGAIFLDTIHSLDGKGLKLIYGHHMKSSWKYGVMFRELVNYRNKDYMADHSDVVIWTDAEELHYKPIYCYAGAADGAYRNRLKLQGELNEFFRNRQGFEPGSDDVLVLVTCSYGQDDERTYVVCVRQE